MLLWFVIALIFRWRFQFSIRSLLIMAVITAVVPLADDRYQRGKAESGSGYGNCGVEWQLRVLISRRNHSSLAKLRAMFWLKRLLSVDICFNPIKSVFFLGDTETDATLEHLEDWTNSTT